MPSNNTHTIAADVNVLVRMWRGTTVPTTVDELARDLYARRRDNDAVGQFAGCIADEVLHARGLYEFHISRHVLLVAVALWTRKNSTADSTIPHLTNAEARQLARLFVELAECTFGGHDRVDTSREALLTVARTWFDDFGDDRKVLAHVIQHDIDLLVTSDKSLAYSCNTDGIARTRAIRPFEAADRYADRRYAAV